MNHALGRAEAQSERDVVVFKMPFMDSCARDLD
jgi:hypothetical protein